jgi:hypothetical protein
MMNLIILKVRGASWNLKHETAAQSIAESHKTDQQITEIVGVSVAPSIGNIGLRQKSASLKYVTSPLLGWKLA